MISPNKSEMRLGSDTASRAKWNRGKRELLDPVWGQRLYTPFSSNSTSVGQNVAVTRGNEGESNFIKRLTMTLGKRAAPDIARGTMTRRARGIPTCGKTQTGTRRGEVPSKIRRLAPSRALSSTFKVLLYNGPVVNLNPPIRFHPFAPSANSRVPEP